MDFSLPADLAPKLEAMRNIVDSDVIPLERVMAEKKSFRALGLSSRYALLRLLKKHGIVVKRQSSAD